LTGCHSHPDRGPDPTGPGTIGELTEGDTILINDLLGTPIAELSGSGRPIGHFSSYPFGAARADTSKETQKYAGAPRDSAVSLDAMGARFYSPSLGVWSRGDPYGLTSPEHLVTEDFAASNPYVYAKDSPLLVADRDGHFWNIAAGAFVGALMGGGIEAGRQYWSTGRIESWGRVGAAASGGGISGMLLAACPAAGLSGFSASNALSGVADGITRRLIESGGQSAGTLKEAVFDAGMSIATAGVMKGGGALVGGAVKRVPAIARSLSAIAGASAPKALGAARQVEAAWSASTYREGGLMTGMEHVFYRHSAESGFSNVSRYAGGTTARNVAGYVDEALRLGKVTPSGNSFMVEHDMGRIIGTDVVGKAASSIRVFVRDGVIQTAFPF
jgi:RHS repeat-associated protein